MDNIITLTNRIHWGFLKKRSTIAVFLGIAGAFDNVIPAILFEDLREIGLPAKVYKFVENLLSERQIYSVINGSLQPPLTSRKGTPQGSILSPILFSIYLRKISSVLHPDTQILQYADDILFSNLQDIALARNSLCVSLEAVYSFLRQKGLDLAPHKSNTLIFSKRRKGLPLIDNISLQGVTIEKTSKVRFLGILLDEKLSGKEQFKSMIVKGNKVAKIILSLSGIWWGAHPSLLLLLYRSIYRSIYRSSIEYGAQIFSPFNNENLWLKIQRIQFRIIRFRITSINPHMCLDE